MVSTKKWIFLGAQDWKGDVHVDCESDLWMDNPRRSNLIRLLVHSFQMIWVRLLKRYDQNTLKSENAESQKKTFHSEAELVQAKENAGKWVILFLLCCSLMVLVRLNMLLVIIVVIVIINMIGIAIRVVILIIFDEPDHIDVVWMIILVQSH